MFQWLREWFADRSLTRYFQLQEWNLSLHERNLTLKTVKNELKFQSIMLKQLKREEEFRQRKPQYAT